MRFSGAKFDVTSSHAPRAHGVRARKSRYVPPLERNVPGLDEIPTMHREVLAHFRVDIVCPDRKPAFGIESCVDARSRLQSQREWRPESQFAERDLETPNARADPIAAP